MSEQIAVDAVESTDAEPNVSEATDTATGQEQKAETVTFTQADVDRIVSDRLQRAERKAQEATDKATAEAEKRAAVEQGKWKELYEKAEAKAEAERTEWRGKELAMLKEQVARTVGLPGKLAIRLQGEDEESLTADAKSILADLPKPTAPNINSGAGGGAAQTAAGRYGGLTKEELAATYGVNPKYLPN